MYGTNIYIVGYSISMHYNMSGCINAQTPNDSCVAALLSMTGLCYLMSLVAIILFFVFYTRPEGCTVNKFFISFNMILCISVSVISVLPKVQVSVSSVWSILSLSCL